MNPVLLLQQTTLFSASVSVINNARNWCVMNKAAVSSILVAVVLLAVAIAEAQQPKKVSRLGYLSSSDPTSESARSEAIRLGLRELGYIDGQNIAIEYRYGEGKLDRAPELAAELVRLKVDIIVVAAGGSWIRATINATKTIPIVMTGLGSDPVEAGFIESLARPGGNVTGLTNLTGELGGKRLELLKEAVPKIARVAVLYDPALPANVHELKEVLPAAAHALGLTVQPWEVRVADSFEQIFVALNKERPDAIYVTSATLMLINQKRIVAGLCTMGWTSRTATGASHTTWTESSREPSPRICPSSNRRSSSSLSI